MSCSSPSATAMNLCRPKTKSMPTTCQLLRVQGHADTKRHGNYVGTPYSSDELKLRNFQFRFQVVQQLLRHGADLHSLDKNALKPLDFRKYFGERRDDIMQAVQDTLQYK